MNKFIKIVWGSYSLAIKTIFFLFLLCVLSIGRSFSAISYDAAGIPLFITEIMLLVSLPFILLSRAFLSKLPKMFLLPLLLFFVLGCINLLLGMLERNLFALRDIVLCGYILFLPLTLIVFPKKKDLISFLVIVLLGSLFAVIAGRFIVLNSYPSLMIKSLLGKTKTLNLGFTYGLVVSFLVPFYFFVKSKLFRVFILVLISLNFYMIIIMGVRTLWLAYIALVIFLAIILKRRFIKLGLNLVLCSLVICTLIFSLDFRLIHESHKGEAIIAKAGSFSFFIKKVFIHKIAPQKKSSQKILSDSNSCVVTAIKSPASSVNTDKSSILPTISAPAGASDVFNTSLSNIIWRFDIWKQAIDFGLKSPLYGRGFGVYPSYIVWEHYAPVPKDFGVNSGIIPTHNHLISIFYKMGLLGLFIFLFVNFYAVAYGLSYINKCKDTFNRWFLIGSLGAFVFWHTMAALFDIIDSPPTSIFLWIIMGFIFSVIAIDKDEKKIN